MPLRKHCHSDRSCHNGSAVELIANPELLAQAQEEFRKRVGPKGYDAPIPKDVVPRPMGSLKK